MNELATYSGGLDEVRYRTIIGWVGAENSTEPVRIALRINGEVAGETEAAGRFEFVTDVDVLPHHSVEVLVFDNAGHCVRELKWGLSGRPLPESWRSANHYGHPSLFVIGAAKSGTTSLHAWLDQHPDVFMSKPKEPFFFEMEYERGMQFYFSKYFGGWRGESVVGESRHRNLYFPYVAARIHAVNPDAKLIAVLRNPAERAVSHWWHWRSRGLEPLAAGPAFEADIARIETIRMGTTPDEIVRYRATLGPYAQGQYRTYIDSGYYCEQLERYLRLFRKEQLLVILFEELTAQPAAVMKRVFEFLEVDPGHAPRLNLNALNQSNPGAWADIDEALWAKLRRHYEPHNRRLERLLGVSLAHWDNSRVPVPTTA